MPIEETVFYEGASGESPVMEFIEELPDADQARLLAAVEAFVGGVPKRADRLHQASSRELWEMRVGRFRLLYGVAADVLLISHAFMKKTQKTPKRDLDL